MGMFLSITSVIGKTQSEVARSLANYAASAGGGLETEVLLIENENCCVIAESDGNTTIFNPYAYLEWDKSSEFISRDLSAPVFSFHIHDGDLWMYILFVNGETVDQFNPIPDYWDDTISEDEISNWRGDATVICHYLPFVAAADMENYLVRWDLDAENPTKAYPDDRYSQEDWQLLDFMNKIRLPYPLNDDGTPLGRTYKLWTKELSLSKGSKTLDTTTQSSRNEPPKPWWKIW
jgi:hypothetical protein